MAGLFRWADWDENLGFDKIAGSDFEQWSEATLARRAEGRMPGVILVRQPTKRPASMAGLFRWADWDENLGFDKIAGRPPPVHHIDG